MPCGDRRGHSLLNLLFAKRAQAFITRHTASERAQQPREIESAHHLGGLSAAIGLAQPIPTGYGGVFEQPAIPRQQDAFLFGRDPHQFRIAGAISVVSVESEHA